MFVAELNLLGRRRSGSGSADLGSFQQACKFYVECNLMEMFRIKRFEKINSLDSFKGQ